MDFYKKCKNSSSSRTSSTSSSHSDSSDKSYTSSNGGQIYNLEYCTSTSSLSPQEIAITSRKAAAKYLLHNVTALDQYVPATKTEELILTTSSSSSSSAHPASSSHSLLRSSVSSTSSIVAPSTSHNISSQNTAKRKRRSSFILAQEDTDHGYEPPSAKRQQRNNANLYHSDSGSAVSSEYPSPVDELLVHELDSRSSSDCLSTATEYELVAKHSDIPDSPESPESLQNDADATENDLHDDDADDEIVSDTTSPSASSTASIIIQPVRRSNSVHHYHHGERTPGTAVPSNGENDQSKEKSCDDYISVHYNCMTPAAEIEPPRLCPLPALSWANAYDVWQLMCKKDEKDGCMRSGNMLEQHPSLQPRMRAVLLDWLIEVCEVYKLHRETYYLAVDYLDRYLYAQKQVPKTHLQLIGITCLFVAAKVEEIYPPKIGEFAYVTDGACREEDILMHELLLLQALGWNINPVTPIAWLGIYMQLNVNNNTPASLKKTADSSKLNEGFIYPQFSSLEFVQASQLLDVCSLDVGIADFSYSVIAAAAMSHTFDKETALRCSGFDWQSIECCVRWMEPFFKVTSKESPHVMLLEQNEQVPSKYGLGHICPNINTDDSYIIQTHTTTMAMFDNVCLLQEQQRSIVSKFKQEASPATGLACPEGLLTPPASSRKPLDAIDEELVADGEESTDDAESESNDIANCAKLASISSSDCSNSNKAHITNTT